MSRGSDRHYALETSYTNLRGVNEPVTTADQITAEAYINNLASYDIEHTAVLSVNGRVIDEQTYNIPGDGSVLFSFPVEFPSAGEYEIDIDGETVDTITVEDEAGDEFDPSAVSITGCSLSDAADDLEPGDTFYVMVGVENDNSVPIEADVDIEAGSATWAGTTPVDAGSGTTSMLYITFTESDYDDIGSGQHDVTIELGDVRADG